MVLFEDLLQVTAAKKNATCMVNLWIKENDVTVQAIRLELIMPAVSRTSNYKCCACACSRQRDRLPVELWI